MAQCLSTHTSRARASASFKRGMRAHARTFVSFEVDIDSYDCDVLGAVLVAGFRPRLVIIETLAIPPPLFYSLRYPSAAATADGGGGATAPVVPPSVSHLAGCSLACVRRRFRDGHPPPPHLVNPPSPIALVAGIARTSSLFARASVSLADATTP